MCAGVLAARAHAHDPPGRRPAERKEQQDPLAPEEGMGGAALERSIDLEVGEHERLRVGAALERDARSFPNRAVGAIAADDVAAAHLLCASVGAAQRAGDSVIVRREADELDAALDRHSARREMLVQDRLCLGLRDEEQEREGSVLEPDVEEAHAHDPVAEVHTQLDGVVASLDQGLCDPEPPQHLERARLHRERARLVHTVELTIDDPDASPELVQPGGERETRRAGADDHDVRRCGHGCSISLPFCSSTLSSIVCVGTCGNSDCRSCGMRASLCSSSGSSHIRRRSGTSSVRHPRWVCKLGIGGQGRESREHSRAASRAACAARLARELAYGCAGWHR
jgi:hypothetical protein